MPSKAECATVAIMPARHPTSFRRTAQALRLLARLAAQRNQPGGLSGTGHPRAGEVGAGDARAPSRPSAIVARLQHASSAAVTTLLKIRVDPAALHFTRVRAADSVLDHSAKAIEIEDIEARVAELERASQLKVNP